jgi:hypothetical protein
LVAEANIVKRQLFRAVRKEYSNSGVNLSIRKNHFNDPAFWDSVIELVNYLRKNPELLAPLELKWDQLTEGSDDEGIVSKTIVNPSSDLLDSAPKLA